MISGFLFSGQFCNNISTSFTSVNSSGLLTGFSKCPGLKYYIYVTNFEKDKHTVYNSLGTFKKKIPPPKKKINRNNKDWKEFKKTLCPFSVSG